MKRVKAACLYQTLSFTLDPNVPNNIALEKVKNEVANYKAKGGSKLQILNEKTYEDGSVEIKVRKMVNGYSIGNYFNE